MLQQTQVITVLPYYARFLARFPTLESLAQAPEQDVLKLWAGLGYYSRARNLHRGADYLVKNHGGKFPKDRQTLLTVPGIGPYTAGAILSIAFDLPEAIVDGNVQRVFSRYYRLEAQLESKQGREFFWETAAKWVERAASPRLFNQALMELGATLCSKANPHCALCPLTLSCKARKSGVQALYPIRKARRPMETLWWGPLVYRKGEKVLLELNGPGEWWTGLWDFPHVAASSEPELRTQVHQRASEEPRVRLEGELDRQQHTVTHHRIHVSPFVLRWNGKTSSSGKRVWVSADEARKLPLSSLAEKVLRSLAAN